LYAVFKLEEKLHVFEKLRDLICEQLKVSEDSVVMDASIVDDLGADSLDMVDLAMNIEEAFDITVDDSDLEGIKTVGDAVAYIEKNLK
jgi:acyl carrier protein